MEIAKLLVSAIAILYIYFLGKNRKYEMKQRLLAVICVILAAVAFWNFTGGILKPTDRLQITALGEKSETALADEVFITGITVDGKHTLVEEVEQGKWFWAGESYAWRNEQDTRQPEGTTRQIVLRIPVGTQRQIHFRTGEYSGYAEVTSPAVQQIVDTSSVETFDIGSSTLRDRVGAIALGTVCYAFLLFAAVTVVQVLTAKCAAHPEQAKTWFYEHSGKIVYILIAVLVGTLMYRYSGRESMWADEMSTMKSVLGSLKDSLHRCATLEEATPPLFFVVATLWHRIVPYGQENLLLLSVIFTGAAVYLTGCAAEKIRGKFSGVISALMLALSATVWPSCANEFRAYAMTLFLMAASLVCYMNRHQFEQKKRWHILFSVTMACLCMTFYFGVFACASYFFADLYLIHKKKMKPIRLVDYVFPALLFAAWFVVVFLVSVSKNQIMGEVTWQPVPNVGEVRNLFSFLTGYTSWQFNIFWIGLGCGVATLLNQLHKKKAFCDSDFYRVLFSLSIIGTVGLLVIWGKWINQTYTMWYPRYFVCLFPLVTILSAMVIEDICGLFQNRALARRAVVFAIAVVMALNVIPQMSSLSSSQPFREAADWLYAQENTIYNDDTLVIVLHKYSKGFEYYLYQNGRRDPINYVGVYDLTPQMLEGYNHLYVQYSHGEFPPDVQEVLQNEFTFVAGYENVHIWEYIRNQA